MPIEKHIIQATQKEFTVLCISRYIVHGEKMQNVKIFKKLLF